MEAPEGLRCLARNGLREMAACGLKSRGLRRNGGLLLAGCCADLSRDIAGGGTRDRHAGAARAGHQLSLGDARPASSADAARLSFWQKKGLNVSCR